MRFSKKTKYNSQRISTTIDQRDTKRRMSTKANLDEKVHADFECRLESTNKTILHVAPAKEKLDDHKASLRPRE